MNQNLHTYVFFLGSHPEISATECWSVLTSRGYNPALIAAHERYLILSVTQSIDAKLLNQLGGIDRVATVLTTRSETPKSQELLSLLSPLPEKFTIGISAVATSAPKTSYMVALKKQARELGGRLKFISLQGRSQQLNTAQVLFNSLYKDPNFEITFIAHQNQIFIARTIWAQDIQAYELRDTKRPVRRGKVGMLPPKLAQIMLNIAISHLTPEAAGTTQPALNIFDPFAGGGTVLQEGWLMGHNMKGADSEPSMANASKKNIDWVKEHFPVNQDAYPQILIHDASKPYHDIPEGSIDAVVTEPFLGRPLSAPLPRQELEKHLNTLGVLYRAALTTCKPLLKKGGVIVFLLPAFRQSADADSDFWLFPPPFIDGIEKIGYHKLQLIPGELAGHFEATHRNTLLYARPTANVGREITLWKKAA